MSADPAAGMARETRPLGTPGEPLRAVAFGSGGFDTAMQVGVAHALLVIQGKAPDAVVGISAGAINAVALAEILQAEGAPVREGVDPAESRQRGQVSRFREILEAYVNAPAELAAACLPDMLQIQAGKSLDPLRLPIHHRREREGRDHELHARQGFIRLCNFLLRTRITFAVMTRILRRGLGMRAAGQLRSRSARAMVYVIETFRSWSAIGLHLPQIADLTGELIWRPLFARARSHPGTTAARILYARGWLRAVRRTVLVAGAFAWLAALWLGATLLVVLAVWAAVRGLLQLPPWWRTTVIGGGVAFVAWMGLRLRRAGIWRQLTIGERNPRLRLLGELVVQTVEVAALGAVYLVVPVGVAYGVQRLGLSPGWTLPGIVAGLLAVGAIVPTLLVGIMVLRHGEDWRRRFLEQFDLADGLLSRHPLRDLFARHFDPGYYGPRNMDDVVEQSLRSEDRPSESEPTRKLLRDYTARTPPIEVGLMVANVGTGELEIVPGGQSVVDGLYAATAMNPLLPPAEMPGRLYLDGGNIGSEATPGVLELLRGRVADGVPVVHVYSVAPLPFSSPVLRDDETERVPAFVNLLDVVRRAFLLERFRDASLERRLTELYTKALTPGRATYTVGDDTYLRAWVTPVEPDRPVELNDRLLGARTPEERRAVVCEAVAEGCRAALQVMIRASQEPAVAAAGAETWRPCRKAVEVHLEGIPSDRRLPLLADHDPNYPTPYGTGAGLPEVCRHCRLADRDAKGKDEGGHRLLHFRRWERIGPAWPHLSADPPAAPPADDPHFRRAITDYDERTLNALRTYRDELARGTDTQPAWPRPGARDGAPGAARPLVSLLFSGGVFRGVYQLGTLNALAELDLVPDVVAGASVGSITGAMIAEAMSWRGAERRGRVARLAATYLALDRLILTDRFADFIRGLTLRAGATHFSLADADHVFRQYDRTGAGRINRRMRRVAAGLERLFWLSPFELHELLRTMRLADHQGTVRLLQRHAQEWLDRMGVGREVLGAEPLALLIAEHVLRPAPGGAALADPRAEPFDRFLDRGIYFLATATNLSMGRLEVLGEQQFAPTPGRKTAGKIGTLRPNFLEGLLASSAFPGVFRPRWSWEVIPGSNARHQYIDGGVMDNLPLDAVAGFLHDAATVGLIAERPTVGAGAVPHLLFSASLEPEVSQHHDIADLERFRRDWVEMRSRARKLRYNKKLALYERTQAALRAITASPHRGATWTAVDLEVVTVKPAWLPGTFGFHPMLGFRRDTQAESIAHGCATTLAVFADLAHDPERRRPEWLAAWGVDTARLPGVFPRERGWPAPQAHGAGGTCWFRPGCDCPFARRSLEALPAPSLPETTIAELDRIHRACGRPATHQPRD